MAHLSTISAAMFTDLSVAFTANTGGVATAALPASYTQALLQGLFVTAASSPKYLQVFNVREFPAVGAPANIVNVPVFGQRQSQTVGGQSDAPSLEVTLNYIPNEWAKGTTATTFTNNVRGTLGNELGNMVGDGVGRIWRMTLLAAAPVATQTATLSNYDSAAGGLSTTQNSQFFWLGKLESLLVTPSLTDATTATIAFSIQSDFYGPFTN
jgi:hypothetical protein